MPAAGFHPSGSKRRKTDENLGVNEAGFHPDLADFVKMDENQQGEAAKVAEIFIQIAHNLPEWMK